VRWQDEALVVSGPSWILQVISTWPLSLNLCPRGHPVSFAKALSVRGDDSPVWQRVYSWISSLQLVILSTQPKSQTWSYSRSCGH